MRVRSRMLTPSSKQVAHKCCHCAEVRVKHRRLHCLGRVDATCDPITGCTFWKPITIWKPVYRFTDYRFNISSLVLVLRVWKNGTSRSRLGLEGWLSRSHLGLVNIPANWLVVSASDATKISTLEGSKVLPVFKVGVREMTIMIWLACQ